MLVCIMVFSTTIKYEYFDIDEQDYKLTDGSSLTLSLFDEKNDPATNFTSGDCNPAMVTVGSKIVYSCYHSSALSYYKVYASDGQSTPIELKDGLIPASPNTYPPNTDPYFNPVFAVVGDIAYFTAHESGYGYELFSTDGTINGTSMVKDINPYGDSNVQYMANIDGKLYFSADDGVHGMEPWVSDGTPAGTRMIQDIVKGPASSNPSEFVEANGDVYFAANNSQGERHLYRDVWQSGVANHIWEIEDGSVFGEASAVATYGDAVYMAYTGGDDNHFLFADNASGTWQFASTTTITDVSNISLVVDSNGTRHVALIQNSGTTKDLVYMSRTGTASWGNNDLGSGYRHTSISLDSQNNPYITSIKDHTNGDMDLEVKKRNGPCWFCWEHYDIETTTSANEINYPFIAIDSKDNVHVIALFPSTNQIKYYESLDSANNLSQWIVNTDSTLSPGSSSSLALNEDDRVSIVAGNTGTNPAITYIIEARSAFSSTVNYSTDSLIGSGINTNCALDENGEISCWGSGLYGKLGTGSTTGSDQPVFVSGVGGYSQLTSGDDHTCAIKNNVDIYCWGGNFEGQFGSGNTSGSSTPILTTSFNSSIISIEAGGKHTCALLANGDMYCWGRGVDGQIGYNNATTTYSPQLVLLPRSAIAIDAGDSHTCAILDNNSMMCWGSNDFGQVGDGTTNQRDVPVYVENFIGANVYPIAVSGGSLHTCALLNDGSINCWGRNNNGQLGTYSGDSSSPVSISLGSNVSAMQITSNGGHNCVLLTNKTLNCWGQNNWGQVGDGTITNKFVPTYVEMENQESVEYVSASKDGVCVVLENLKLSCWGANYDGQVGDGTTIAKVKPTSIGILGYEIYDFSGASIDYFSSLSSVFIEDKIWVSYQNASGFAVSNSYDTISHGINFHTIQESAYTNGNSLATGPNGEIYAGVTFEDNFYLMGRNLPGQTGWVYVQSDYHLLGTYSAFDVDAYGDLHMVYHDDFTDELIYSVSSSSNISFEVIDNTTDSGFFNSLEVDVYGNIHIAYQANNKLKYAKKLSTSNNWNVSTIDSAQGSGYDGSMTLDQWQNPHIAYGTDYDGLKYAAFNGASWNIETVDSNQYSVYWTSIAIDGMENVHIAYCELVSNYTEFNLKHAKKSLNSAGASWSKSNVDSNGNVGASAKIVVDSYDNIHIGYIDFDNANLKLATQMAGTTSYSISSIYSGTTLQRIGMDLDSNDDFHFSIVDSGTNKIRYMNNIGGSWNDSYVDPILMIAATKLVVDENDDVHLSYLSDQLAANYVTISGYGDYLGASIVSEEAFEPYGMIEFDNHTYFVATDSQGNNFELWRTDGTPEGTVNYNLNPNGSAFFNQGWPLFGVLNNHLIFHADNAGGIELWASDGTTSGTTVLKDINPGDGDSMAYVYAQYTFFNNELYFAADNGANGSELWKTDGTQQGTVMVKDINFGSAGSWPHLRKSVELDGKMYFSATTSTQGREIWVTQGSESTTHIVSDLFVGPSAGINFASWALLGDTIFFSGRDSAASGFELWKATSGSGTDVGIVYDLENFEFAINEYVYEFPTLINFWGENVSGYSIQPAAMPAGLNFNTSSGVISGTTTSAFSTQIYTITASTVLGFDLTTEISITVEDDGAPTLSVMHDFNYLLHHFVYELDASNIATGDNYTVNVVLSNAPGCENTDCEIWNGTTPELPWTASVGQATGFNLSLYDQICMHATLVHSGYDDDSIEVCDDVPHFFTGEVNTTIDVLNHPGYHEANHCTYSTHNDSWLPVSNVCDQVETNEWVSPSTNTGVSTDSLAITFNYSNSVSADRLGVYILRDWYASKLDKGRLLAYNYTNSEWDEIGIFDLPEINEPAWVILSGFSVESDLFMIDIDTNSGNFGHTVLWELALFDSDFVPTYEPDIQMNFDSENDVIVEVNLTGMNPEIAYRFDLHVHYPGIPFSSNNFGEVYHYQENLTLGINEKQFEFTINRSDFIENVVFCIDANLFYVSNQSHLTGNGNCFDLSNHAIPHIQHLQSGFDKISEVSFFEVVLNNADLLSNGSVVEMLVSPNGTIYNWTSALNLNGDIDYEVNLSHQVGEVLPNGEVFSYYEDYCHVIIVFDGEQMLQNLVDVEYMCHYIDNDAEIHVLLDMENQTDSYFGFEIRNMSRDYEYIVNGTVTEDSNQFGNFNYGPIPNAGAGSTHTNWVSQFSPLPGKEYCIEAVLSEKWIHDPFAPWMNSRSANYCITFDGNQTNENNTGNQSTPGPEIFANLTLESALADGDFSLAGSFSLSNVTIGETYNLQYSIFHAKDNTCSEVYIPENGFADPIIYNENLITVNELMTMSGYNFDSRDIFHPTDYSRINYSIIDSYYCLRLELVSNETVIDTDIDAIPFEATLDEPNPELFVEFYEDEEQCTGDAEALGYCDEGVMVYAQKIDIQLDGAWYGYNHSISLKLANENGIIIYSYLSANDDYYQNGGWHPVYTNDYDDLSMNLMAPITNINAFTEDNNGPIYWKGDTNSLTLNAGEDSELIWEYPSFEAGEYCLEISIGYQKDLNDSSFTSFRNLFDKQTYCGIFEHDSGEGLHWDSVDEDETCDDLTDASCVELLCENWEEQNPMLVDPRLENNGCPYELEIPDWWEEIPIVGDQINNIVETVQNEFGRYIGAVVFAVTVLGYAYRALTARSNFKKAKRMKKFERKIDKSNSKKDLDKVDADVEKAEDKNLLPTGGYGDLKEMIETRLEELFGDGSSGGDEANESMSRGFGYEDANDMFNEMQSGMEAMRETQQEMARMAESMRENQDSLFRQNLAPRAGAQRGGPKRPSQRPTPQVESLGKASGGPSRPSYHPKDLDEDGVVSEEDLQNWEKLSEAEKRARLTGSVRGGGSLTSEIVAFSKIPGSSKARCYCGSGKAYGKCHLSKEMCPCGSGKKFLKCCAKKRGFR